MSAALDLWSRGIRIKNPDRPGEHRAACPQCDRGPRDDALAVKIDPDGEGATWTCHRCGWTGGIGPGRSERSDIPPQPRRERERQPAPERHETLAPWARALWSTCLPITEDGPAAAYLRNRGCALPPWPEESDLRWHPAIKNRKEGHVGPALVALVTDVETGEPISLHRTWLKPDGSGKAELHKPRLLLTRHRSDGVIRLWPDEEVGTGLAIGEGIETCLAAARAGITPIWSTISAGNMAAFPVLRGLEGLIVVADHDLPDKRGRRAGIAAAAAVIERYTSAGFDPERDLVVILPPVEGQDANDLAAAQ